MKKAGISEKVPIKELNLSDSSDNSGAEDTEWYES